MYKIILILLILTSFQCSKHVSYNYFINENNDIIIMKNDSMLFFSKACIVPNTIFKTQNRYYINSDAITCSSMGKVYDIDLAFLKGKDRIKVSSSDSCFVKYFKKENSEFHKVIPNEMKYYVKWDSVNIKFIDYTDNIINKSINELNESEIILMYLIQSLNKDFAKNCQDCIPLSVTFYYKNKTTYKNSFNRLPCWLLLANKDFNKYFK